MPAERSAPRLQGALRGVVTPRGFVHGGGDCGQDDPRSRRHPGRYDVRFRRVLPVPAALLLMSIAAPAAGAAVPHTVQPGETLWSIAAANNLTTRTVAAFNGLSENSQVVLGSTVMVASPTEGSASLQKAVLVSATPPAAAPVSAAAPAAAPQPLGGYT